jgi:DNA-binding NtrC family response regulator
MDAPHRFGGAVAASAVMARVFEVLRRAAASDAAVLLEGETGTGKSLLARELHATSRRADQPLVFIDCGALDDRNAQHELFGWERPGALEAAHGGTIVLDDVDELPRTVQAHLNAALERRSLTRIGAARPVPFDVRVIATTQRPLRQEIGARRFRSDLFYRLNTVTVRLPPLHDRPEDVPVLAAWYHQRVAGPDATVPPELLEMLGRGTWTGNARELQNAVERMVLLGDLAPEPAEPASAPSYAEARDAVLGRWEEGYLRLLLGHARGNLSHAARTAGIDRSYLRQLLKRHALIDGSRE